MQQENEGFVLLEICACVCVCIVEIMSNKHMIFICFEFKLFIKLIFCYGDFDSLIFKEL